MLSLTLMFVAGCAWTKGWAGIKSFLKTPYHYYCPDCDFKFRASSKDVADNIKLNHESHHEKG